MRAPSRCLPPPPPPTSVFRAKVMQSTPKSNFRVISEAGRRVELEDRRSSWTGQNEAAPGHFKRWVGCLDDGRRTKRANGVCEREKKRTGWKIGEEGKPSAGMSGRSQAQEDFCQSERSFQGGSLLMKSVLFGIFPLVMRMRFPTRNPAQYPSPHLHRLHHHRHQDIYLSLVKRPLIKAGSAGSAACGWIGRVTTKRTAPL